MGTPFTVVAMASFASGSPVSAAAGVTAVLGEAEELAFALLVSPFRTARTLSTMTASMPSLNCI
jgi:hypothetical protein